MRLRAGSTTFIISLAVALAASGCGSGGSNSSSSATSSQSGKSSGGASGNGSSNGSGQAQAAALKPPKNASPVLQEIYRQFPPPQGNPKVKRSAVAIEAGKRACAGKTPVEVKDKYFPIAVQKGTLKPDSEQGKMIAGIQTYANRVSKDSSFAAGQLAADAYQATLPVAIGQYGFQGCVYVLARRLERQLAPK